ncbi:transcriptional regulator [Leptospira wolffii]|nr:transcriptional regulator [Leptospira wolffii]
MVGEMEENFEQKIERALNGEKNEYSSSLQSLSHLLSKPLTHSSEFESFETIYQKASRPTILTLSKPAFYWLSAAAVLFIGFVSFYTLQKRQPTNSPESGIEISKIFGKGYLLSNEEKLLSLNEGETVGLGQILRTDKDSQLFLNVSKGEAIAMEGETELEILKDSKQSFRLRRGGILVHLHKNLKKEEFRIFTAVGTVEVRGTKFEVRERDGEGTVVAVLEGRVATKGLHESDRGEQVLEPGQKIRMESKGFQRSFLTSSELGDLNQKFKGIQVDEIPRNTEKSFDNKEDLYREYQRFEKVVLASGESYEGVIVDMDEKFMYLQTLKNEIKIPRDSVLEVIQLR